MTLSEMIQRLEEIKEKVGDLDVMIDWGADSAPLEVIHDDLVDYTEGSVYLQMFDTI
jgi:hypothetical protein